jgi:hypothetical protein
MGASTTGTIIIKGKNVSTKNYFLTISFLPKAMTLILEI